MNNAFLKTVLKFLVSVFLFLFLVTITPYRRDTMGAGVYSCTLLVGLFLISHFIFARFAKISKIRAFSRAQNYVSAIEVLDNVIKDYPKEYGLQIEKNFAYGYAGDLRSFKKEFNRISANPHIRETSGFFDLVIVNRAIELITGEISNPIELPPINDAPLNKTISLLAVTLDAAISFYLQEDFENAIPLAEKALSIAESGLLKCVACYMLFKMYEKKSETAKADYHKEKMIKYAPSDVVRKVVLGEQSFDPEHLQADQEPIVTKSKKTLAQTYMFKRKLRVCVLVGLILIGLSLQVYSVVDQDDLEPEIITFIALRTGDPDAYITIQGQKYSTTLRNLILSGRRLSDKDIEPLKEMTKLVHLDLSENNISDIGPLAGLTDLDQLYLYTNDISDISPLKDLKNLNTLYLNKNNITDISALGNLKKMQTLLIDGNSINDFAPLIGLKSMRILSLTDTGVSDAEVAVLQDALPDCIIQ